MISRKVLLMAGLPAAALMAHAAPALAQDATTAETEVTSGDEILVTAQRRTQSVQDVGISIAAFGGQELREMNVQSSVDVARLTCARMRRWLTIGSMFSARPIQRRWSLA